jgi:mycothiol system anti-sigma-R factor
VSCGKPHETPCSEVLEDVYIYLDEECDGVSTSKIRQHLDECSPCLQQFGIEQEVKATLAQIVVSEYETGERVTTVEVTTFEVTTESE